MIDLQSVFINTDLIHSTYTEYKKPYPHIYLPFRQIKNKGDLNNLFHLQ